MAAAAVDSPRPGEEAEYQRLYARELQNEDALVVALMRRSEVRRHAPSAAHNPAARVAHQRCCCGRQFALNDIMYKAARLVQPTATSEGLSLPPGIDENQSFMEFFLYQTERVSELPSSAMHPQPRLTGGGARCTR